MTQWFSSVLTLFPEMFPGHLALSLAGKALAKNVWGMDAINIRNFTLDKHQTVDDACFGGTPGLVLKPDVVDRAIQHAVAQEPDKKKRLIYLTPRGKPLNQEIVRDLGQVNNHVILLSGRYEGVDQRVIDYWDMEEISIGDYILFGGEVAALVLIEACLRMIPGIVGKQESVLNESFELDLLEHPQYTRPQDWNGMKVPDVLLSGHHKNIEQWRFEQSKAITRQRRPDLWERFLKNQDG